MYKNHSMYSLKIRECNIHTESQVESDNPNHEWMIEGSAKMEKKIAKQKATSL
jgi:hypothetical protein